MREIKFKAMNFGGIWWHAPEELTLSTFFNALYPKDGSMPVLNARTLCQFIGKNDRNGTNIYDKDWVKFTTDDDTDIEGVVEFTDDGCYIVVTRDRVAFNFSDILEEWEIEVIGNVNVPQGIGNNGVINNDLP